MKRHQWILLGCGAALVLLVVLEILFAHPHHDYWYHRVGVDIGTGFLGCVAIVLISKALGKRLLQRSEDYYDR